MLRTHEQVAWVVEPRARVFLNGVLQRVTVQLCLHVGLHVAAVAGIRDVGGCQEVGPNLVLRLAGEIAGDLLFNDSPRDDVAAVVVLLGWMGICRYRSPRWPSRDLDLRGATALHRQLHAALDGLARGVQRARGY